MGIVARLAKKPPSADAAHGAAALLGGLTVTTRLSLPQDAEVRHRLLRQPVHADWHYVIALPDVQMGTAETKRVLPPTLPHAATQRSISRTLGVLRALAEADEDLLRACIPDEVHLPYRRRLVPGVDQALDAAVEAGAAGATVCGHGPGLLAFTTVAGRVPEIAKAMVHAFSGARCEATTLTLQTARYGALPGAPDDA